MRQCAKSVTIKNKGMELRISGGRLAVGLFFLALCAGFCLGATSESKSAGLYTELDDSNFETFVDSNPLVLVMYYGTFNRKSKVQLPLFTGLGLVDFFKKRGIKIARVNAGKYESLKHKFMVESLPSFALFAHSVQIKFKEDFTQKALIRFVQEKLLYREEEVQSMSQVSFEHHDFAVVFHANGDDSYLVKAMRGIKMKHYSWNVYRLKDGSVFKGKEGILALRHHDNFKAEYSGSLNGNSPAIEQFLVDSEFPDWSIYNKKTNHWIEEEGYPVLAVLYDGQNLPRTDMVTAAKDLGKQYKHTIITVFVRRDQPITKAAPLLKELSGQDLTEVEAFIVAPTSPYHRKYLLRQDYKAEIYSTAKERLKDFLDHYEDGHLDRYHMTQVVNPAQKKLGNNIEVP